MQRFCKRQCARHAATWLLTLLLALGVTVTWDFVCSDWV